MKLLALFAAVAVLSLANVRGKDDNADLLEQVTDKASQNVDANTAAQVQQFTNENKDAIEAILQGYRAYLNQINMMLDDNPGAPVRTDGASAKPQPKSANANAAINSIQQQDGTHLQLSTGLQGAHLDGYPALPDVEPTSSILNPTALQLLHKTWNDEQIRARKKELQKIPVPHY